MNATSLAKGAIKALFERAPILDILSRRFLYRWFSPRLFFHEPEMTYFDRLPRGSIDVMIDVGAAMGSYCWVLGRAANTIYAFEPGRVHHRLLSRARFGTNIHVVRAAVGSTQGKVSLYTPVKEGNDRYRASISLGNPVTQEPDVSVDEVEQVALDGFTGEVLAPGSSVDLIKVDVEGYELDVFKGALDVLRRHRPLVVCEIEARHNPNFREVFDLFEKLDYTPYIFKNGEFVPFLDEDIEPYQSPSDLETRLHGTGDQRSDYVNNFVFQHADSKVKVR